jgi:protease-4
MGMISALGRALNKWYIKVPLLAVLGIVIGAALFFYVFPGKPHIGIITIPYTVINEESAYVITSYLDYANRNDRIKAVVIRLSSPGGGATSSERLYIESRELRQNKPVIMVLNDLVASGGFMMAMGATHTYVKPSSLVGNVGVVSSTGGVIPPPPSESVISTGPSKLTGATRLEWIGLMDLLKQSFAQTVIRERGDKLRISPEELAEGQLYAGMEAVQLGLADDIGDDTDAIRKAASLAGVSGYELLDVNVEVNRLFVQQTRRIFDEEISLVDLIALSSSNGGTEESVVDQDANTPIVRLGALRKFLLSGSLAETQEDPLPGFPLEINRPNIYYIYVGQSP